MSGDPTAAIRLGMIRGRMSALSIGRNSSPMKEMYITTRSIHFSPSCLMDLTTAPRMTPPMTLGKGGLGENGSLEAVEHAVLLDLRHDVRVPRCFFLNRNRKKRLFVVSDVTCRIRAERKNFYLPTSEPKSSL